MAKGSKKAVKAPPPESASTEAVNPPPAAPAAEVQEASGKKSSGLMSYLNTSTLAVVLFAAYVFYVSMGIRRVMNPYVRPLEEGEPSLDPLWEEGRPFELRCFVSTSSDRAPIHEDPIWRQAGLKYTWSDESSAPVHPLMLTARGYVAEAGVKANETVQLDSRFWSAVRKGREVYLHVYVTRPGGSLDPRNESYDALSTLHGVVPMVKREFRKAPRVKRRLLDGTVVPEPDILMEGDLGLYWKPEVAVRLVTDFTRYPLDSVPVQLMNQLEVLDMWSVAPGSSRAGGQRGRWKYSPPMHVDEIGLTSDKWVGLNASLDHLPLQISYSPMSLQRWQLMAVLEESLRTQKGLGLDDKDIDDVRRLITDTNVILLAVTILASVLHLLFEFLAFQSDINFWRKNKSLRGLSVRSVVIELFCQTVILLFLIDTDTSLLVVVPSAFGIVIQVWKVQRATGLAIVRDGPGGRPRIALLRLEEEAAKAKQQQEAAAAKQSSSTNGEAHAAAGDNGVTTAGTGTDDGSEPEVQAAAGKKKEGEASDDVLQLETLQLDRVAISHLSLVIGPAVLGFAARSLLFEEHASWYSWFISTLTGAVYAGGFILMTPQLYINYRLKSVSHLPWRFLCYRFLNTFIDDLFAFVIRMPTMHRISCFRDDVVFIIYLYQRYIYKVDERRRTDAEDCPS